MHEAVSAHVDACDIFIGVAAVADFRPVQTSSQKIKKRHDAGLSLELVQNPDIIAAVAKHGRRPFVVGFAAETQDTITNARSKLVQKGLDMIVLNDVSDHRIGFDSNENAVTIISREGEERIDIGSKAEISRALIDRIMRMMQRERAARPSEPSARTSASEGGSG
jgi:phosphopantothenoylcysteine decarboxylase/phosphopantothenate--cysteine ligase